MSLWSDELCSVLKPADVVPARTLIVRCYNLNEFSNTIHRDTNLSPLTHPEHLYNADEFIKAI